MNKNKRTIILASASPRRRELLTQIGVEFMIRPCGKEEKCKEQEPEQMVKELSCGKAFAVFEELLEEEKKNALVIGADTLVSYEGRVLGKPGDEREAEKMLNLLQGSTHQVYTGVTMVWQENGEKGKWETKSRSFAEGTLVSMYPMSKEEIRAYIATGEPMDKAGAYGIQGRCAAWIRGISGDYNNVVGLPVGRLYQELKKIECGKGLDEDD